MSGSIDVSFTFKGQEALVAKLKGAPPRLLQFLKTDLVFVAADTRDLAARLAGSRSGKLGASIQGRVVATSNAVSVVLFSEGVPYAAIQERGGTIAARIISAAKARALAFVWGGSGAHAGGYAFFTSVSWPGATITPKHYIRNAMVNKRAEFERVCRAAIAKSLEV